MWIQKPTTCSRCGKLLTDHKSIENNMGPICAAKAENEIGKLQGNGAPGKAMHIITGQAGKGEDIVLKRSKDGFPMVNLYQTKVHHSPNGFEWGYGGSGPSDLALNILLLYLPYKNAFELHHDFKSKFVCGIPEDGGIIKGSDIIAYVQENAKTLFD